MPEFRKSKRTIAAALLAAALATSALSPSHAIRTVFDPWNYQQNILTAARTLTEINQQIDQLRNEAQMLLNMDKNLMRLTQSVSSELMHTLGQIKALMDQGNAIAMTVRQTEQQMQRLFPDSFEDALTGSQVIRQARTRWTQSLAAYKRSASLQARVSENVDMDGRLLSTLLSRSRAAAGNLQASQAGNELTGLSVKQSLQLQQLMAAQYRAQTMDRARRMASEEEARIRFRSFLGSHVAYRPDG